MNLNAIFGGITLEQVNDRVKALEDKVFKKPAKEETTRAQQMLLVKELGLLDKLSEKGLNQTQTAQMLSIILNRSFDNIKDDLTNLFGENYGINTVPNYQFAVKAFEAAKLQSLKHTSETKLEELKKLEETKMQCRRT